MTDSICTEPADEKEFVETKKKSCDSLNCPGRDLNVKKSKIKSDQCCAPKCAEKCFTGHEGKLNKQKECCSQKDPKVCSQRKNVNQCQTDNKKTSINHTQTERAGSKCCICGKPKKSKEEIAKAKQKETRTVSAQTEPKYAKSVDSNSERSFKSCYCNSKKNESDSSCCSCESKSNKSESKLPNFLLKNMKKKGKEKKEKEKKSKDSDKDKDRDRHKDIGKHIKSKFVKRKEEESSTRNDNDEDRCIADDLYALLCYVAGYFQRALNAYCECRAS